MRPVDPAPLAALRSAHARLRLGVGQCEELPDLACALLLADVDTPAVRELAGLLRPTRWEAEPVFARALAELHQVPLDEEQAWSVYARDQAQAIADGEEDPWVGAVKLGAGIYLPLNPPEALTFYVLADEYEEHPDERESIARDIVLEAREYLARSAPDACPPRVRSGISG